MSEIWSYAALAGFGAFHGMNPAMGWLFAVALGLQNRERAAVLRALPPIALGHAASIAVVVAIVAAARIAIDPRAVGLSGAALLTGFGLYRFFRGMRHTARFGMSVGFADLVLWSFLMATAHGSGLMLAPVLLAGPAAAPVPDAAGQAFAAAMLASWCGAMGPGLAAVAVHSAAMLLVTAAVALVVFDRIGLAILRQGWINFDLIWAGALVGTGLILLAA